MTASLPHIPRLAGELFPRQDEDMWTMLPEARPFRLGLDARQQFVGAHVQNAVVWQARPDRDDENPLVLN
jgi:hypothetical protein